MAKRNNKRGKVYYKSDTDTWSNDAMEQPYLMPGTESYKAMQSQNEEKKELKKGDEFHDELEFQNETLRKRQLDKSKMIDEAFNVGSRKFRKVRAKKRVQDQTERIIEDGIGKNVDIKGGIAGDIALGCSGVSKKLVYDDGVNPEEYQTQVIRSYEPEFKEACDKDNNNDGQIDDDDWTPGMHKMARYM